MNTPATASFSAVVLAALAAALPAQALPRPDVTARSVHPTANSFAFEAQSAAWQEFVQRHPGDWETRWCAATGTPKAIYGTGVTVDTWRANTLEEGRRHAHLLLQREAELLGLGTSEFRESIGSHMGNTWCFVFDQYYRGLPVIGGRADVRVHRVGQVSMFGSTAWPIPADFATVPGLDELAARHIAWQAVGTVPPANAQPGTPRQPRLVIWGDVWSAVRAPVHLAWEIPISAVDETGAGPVGRYYVDAWSGAVLHYENDKTNCGCLGSEHGCAHTAGRTVEDARSAAAELRRTVATAELPTADLPTTEPSTAELAPVSPAVFAPSTGTVMAWTRVGVSSISPLVNIPLPGLEVTVPGVGTVVTDSAGQFTVNIAANTNVTIDLNGIHNLLVFGTSATQVTQTLVPNGTTTFQFLWSNANFDFAAHTSTYYWVYRVNEWARALLGNTSQLNTLDLIRPTVNIVATCNAYYTNNSINFYQAGGGCYNSAYSSVVMHEWGHGLDDRYGGVSQVDGLSEGWGDILSMYLLDDPVIGENFLSTGAYLRSGNNNRQYPTGNGVHQQGEAFGGFAWKLRERLATTLATRAMAIALSDTIVVGTIVANAPDQPGAVLEVFLADDNDANLANGTPHSAELAFACNHHSLPYPGTAIGPITNDNCATAIAVQNGINGPFTSVGATTSAPAWPCATGGNDVWFRYDATNIGPLVVELCNQAAFDTALEIFSGDCGSLTSLGCNDDSCGVRSSLTVNVTPGIYHIRVGGKNGATGPFNLDVEGPTGNPASATAYGNGCYRTSKAFYELFATAAAFDLNGVGMQLIKNGDQYLAFPGAAFVPPSGAATSLTLGDDAEVSVSLTAPMAYPGGNTSTLTVCSNGFVSVAAGNGTAPVPSAAAWLGSTQPRWGTWHDFDPSATSSGSVKFEEVAGVAYITWDGVFSSVATTPNTWQLQFDLASGNVAYVWQSMAGTGSEVLVGYAHIAPNTDLGSRDISATLPATFATTVTNEPGLTLAGTAPQLGTTFSLTTTNYPQLSVLGFQVLSFAMYDPGLSLAPLGMPGCQQYVDPTATVVLLPSAGQSVFSAPIPNDTGFMGVQINAQTFALSPGANSLGIVSSNGVAAIVGT